jgi:hypothetical protein
MTAASKIARGWLFPACPARQFATQTLTAQQLQAVIDRLYARHALN